jgi:hypothetical protein
VLAERDVEIEVCERQHLPSPLGGAISKAHP